MSTLSKWVIGIGIVVWLNQMYTQSFDDAMDFSFDYAISIGIIIYAVLFFSWLVGKLEG